MTSRLGLFKGLRADTTQMAVEPGPIVKDFDVVKDIRPGQIAGFVDALADALVFQTAKERCDDSVIPAVAAPAHARFEIVGLAEAAPVIAPILTTLIGMH